MQSVSSLLLVLLPLLRCHIAAALTCIQPQSQSNEEDLVKLLFFKEKLHGTYVNIPNCTRNRT